MAFSLTHHWRMHLMSIIGEHLESGILIRIPYTVRQMNKTGDSKKGGLAVSDAASRNVIDAKRGSEKDARLSISASSASSSCPSTPVDHVSSAIPPSPLHPVLSSIPFVFTLSEILQSPYRASHSYSHPLPHLPVLPCARLITNHHVHHSLDSYSFSLHTSFQPFRFLSFPF
ncbi:hypothetical protein BDP81DRAFT_163593 [Colletotrichum phormii]|uniref:Uncharacterized protein n=1 Tax=Colletotrichum phormii TaxID=359342 RepID=A0AAI9ZYC4_9PEZI|nr:uncharacterized protein BDP81DRAFT_163593 [Colletotrichum phormii]KAK1640453.1 hypothetical protein BDP81DRAFT_163593 [Colletotrichum phormii]